MKEEKEGNYRDLAAWQRGIDMVEAAYRLCRKLPLEERFEMSAQLRKASVSVPCNVAEGQARRSYPQFLYHLGVAQGSLAETDTLVVIAHRLDYVTREEVIPVLKLINEERRILHGLVADQERRLAESQNAARA